jgi:proteasome lid subunit RPN8/RPN11
VKIARQMIEEMVAHAREDLPNECCGIIATRNGEAIQSLRAINAAASPVRYEVDSQDLLRIYRELEQLDAELGAIYHSHTRSAAYPSQTDVNLAKWNPDALYLIVSLQDDRSPDVRAFRIVDEKIDEVALEIV